MQAYRLIQTTKSMAVLQEEATRVFPWNVDNPSTIPRKYINMPNWYKKHRVPLHAMCAPRDRHHGPMVHWVLGKYTAGNMHHRLQTYLFAPSCIREGAIRGMT
jgi:hypothetical protein